MEESAKIEYKYKEYRDKKEILKRLCRSFIQERGKQKELYRRSAEKPRPEEALTQKKQLQSIPLCFESEIEEIDQDYEKWCKFLNNFEPTIET